MQRKQATNLIIEQSQKGGRVSWKVIGMKTKRIFDTEADASKRKEKFHDANQNKI